MKKHNKIRQFLPFGDLGAICYDNKLLSLALRKENGGVKLDIMHKSKVLTTISVDAGLFAYTHHGRWLALESGIAYGKENCLFLFDLQAILKGKHNDEYEHGVEVGCGIPGWNWSDSHNYDFVVDFEKEHVIYNNGIKRTFVELLK